MAAVTVRADRCGLVSGVNCFTMHAGFVACHEARRGADAGSHLLRCPDGRRGTISAWFLWRPLRCRWQHVPRYVRRGSRCRRVHRTRRQQPRGRGQRPSLLIDLRVASGAHCDSRSMAFSGRGIAQLARRMRIVATRTSRIQDPANIRLTMNAECKLLELLFRMAVRAGGRCEVSGMGDVVRIKPFVAPFAPQVSMDRSGEDFLIHEE